MGGRPESDGGRADGEQSATTVKVVVIGAGRAAISLTTRLQRIHKASDVLVIDESGSWLGGWSTRMKRLGASYVRYPALQHPWPGALKLQDFAERAKSAGPKPLVVSDPAFARVPSVRAFSAFCAAEAVISSGSAQSQPPAVASIPLAKGRAVGLECLSDSDSERFGVFPGAMRVLLADGTSVIAEQVVYCSAHTAPNIPAALAHLLGAETGRDAAAQSLEDTTAPPPLPRPPIGKVALSCNVDIGNPQCSVRNQALLVVGGGQEAVTLALSAIDQGASQVTLAARGGLRVQEFDIDPGWFGNKMLLPFKAQADPLARLRMLRDARDKGSFHRLLAEKLDAAVSSGKLNVVGNAEVTSAQWDGAQFRVALATPAQEAAEGHPQDAGAAGGREQWSWTRAGPPKTDTCGDDNAAAGDVSPTAAASAASSASQIIADFIWVACGSTTDVRGDCVLSQLQSGGFPARVLGGLPVLNDDCRWPGAPLYFVGPYTALSVGAAAALPAGHRMAAEAVAAALSRDAAAAADGQRPYEAAAGGIPLDALFDDDEFADPHAPLPLGPGDGPTKRPTRDSSGRTVLVDTSDIPSSLRRLEISGYSWTQEEGGFEVEVRLEIPEPVSRNRCRVGFGERAAELWVVCDNAAYRLFIPRLFKPIIEKKCRFK